MPSAVGKVGTVGKARTVVVLGTGGTIAGAARDATRHTGYQAGALTVADLVAAMPALSAPGSAPLETETVAQLDSSHMDHATWAALRQRAAWHLARPDVAGVVVTHGTDTLEETAYFLHRTLAAPKPLVLTAAMRPATALSPDGPQNLFDAVALARTAGASGACGVVAVLSGEVFAGADLRKVHGLRLAAFSAGDAGLLALLEDGVLRLLRPWPVPDLHAAAGTLPAAAGSAFGDPASWPVVEIVTSHAGARGATLAALVAAGAHGIVIAGTGNGSVHAALLAAAQEAQAAGVPVWRSSRCLLGGVVDRVVRGVVGGVASGAAAGAAGAVPDPALAFAETDLPSAGVLTPAQARIELLLDLLVQRTRRA